MRPIIGITAGFLAAAIAAALLPSTIRSGAWVALGGAYSGVAIVGTVSLRSGIFGPAFTRGTSTRREVALTFDDGPDPRSTPALLDLLRSRDVAAAFFCVGERVRAHPGIVRRCRDEGHIVGNHSDRHSVLTNFFPARPLRRDLERCQAAIEAACGARPAFYRPPFGLTNHALDGVARGLGLEVVGWQARGFDAPSRAPARVAGRILGRVEAGGIIVLHDAGKEPGALVETVTRVLDGLEARGLRVVRLDRIVRA